MKQIYHLVGTDTDIGKTYTTCRLIKYLKQLGYNANGLKPLSSGQIMIDGNYINSDTYQLMCCNQQKLPQEIINPLNFPEAIAPHIAAQLHQQTLSAQLVIEKITNSLNYLHDGYVFIEGVGGVMVPLNDNETYLEVLQQVKAPIIVVIGIKLGCLNHAQLTLKTLSELGLPLAGWIANQVDKTQEYYLENIYYLQNKLPLPLLAQIDHGAELQPTNEFKEIFTCN